MATRAQVDRALELYETELSAYPNVVGLGTTGSGDTAGIAVYVSEKLPASELSTDEQVPDHVEIPARDGTTQVPVTVEEIGTVVPETNAETNAESAADTSEAVADAAPDSESYTVE